jgi:hypothetical protein
VRCACGAQTRVVKVRTGVVLGREGGALVSMLPSFQFGMGNVMGDGRQYFPWVHLDDIVGLYEVRPMCPVCVRCACAMRVCGVRCAVYTSLAGFVQHAVVNDNVAGVVNGVAPDAKNAQGMWPLCDGTHTHTHTHAHTHTRTHTHTHTHTTQSLPDTQSLPSAWRRRWVPASSSICPPS